MSRPSHNGEGLRYALRKKHNDEAMGRACRPFHAKPGFLGQHQHRATQPSTRLQSSGSCQPLCALYTDLFESGTAMHSMNVAIAARSSDEESFRRTAHITEDAMRPMLSFA